MPDRTPAVSASWLRAVHLATTSLDLTESLNGLLQETGMAVGAKAGAVVDGTPPTA